MEELFPLIINAVKKKVIERYNSFFKEVLITGRTTVKGRTLDKLRAFETFKNSYKMENNICVKQAPIISLVKLHAPV